MVVNSNSSWGHSTENNIDHIGITETDDNDYISKFADTDCKNSNEDEVLEVNKKENGFHFLLSPNSIHKTIFYLKHKQKILKLQIYWNFQLSRK